MIVPIFAKLFGGHWTRQDDLGAIGGPSSDMMVNFAKRSNALLNADLNAGAVAGNAKTADNQEFLKQAVDKLHNAGVEDNDPQMKNLAADIAAGRFDKAVEDVHAIVGVQQGRLDAGMKTLDLDKVKKDLETRYTDAGRDTQKAEDVLQAADDDLITNPDDPNLQLRVAEARKALEEAAGKSEPLLRQLQELNGLLQRDAAAHPAKPPAADPEQPKQFPNWQGGLPDHMPPGDVAGPIGGPGHEPPKAFVPPPKVDYQLNFQYDDGTPMLKQDPLEMKQWDDIMKDLGACVPDPDPPKPMPKVSN